MKEELDEQVNDVLIIRASAFYKNKTTKPLSHENKFLVI
jgi:hypothetical protein